MAKMLQDSICSYKASLRIADVLILQSTVLLSLKELLQESLF